jgi:hypothetical protein
MHTKCGYENMRGEVSLDGAAVVGATALRRMLRKWGVEHFFDFKTVHVGSACEVL